MKKAIIVCALVIITFAVIFSLSLNMSPKVIPVKGLSLDNISQYWSTIKRSFGPNANFYLSSKYTDSTDIAINKNGAIEDLLIEFVAVQDGKIETAQLRYNSNVPERILLIKMDSAADRGVDKAVSMDKVLEIMTSLRSNKNVMNQISTSSFSLSIGDYIFERGTKLSSIYSVNSVQYLVGMHDSILSISDNKNFYTLNGNQLTKVANPQDFIIPQNALLAVVTKIEKVNQNNSFGVGNIYFMYLYGS